MYHCRPDLQMAKCEQAKTHLCNYVYLLHRNKSFVKLQFSSTTQKMKFLVISHVASLPDYQQHVTPFTYRPCAEMGDQASLLLVERGQDFGARSH